MWGDAQKSAENILTKRDSCSFCKNILTDAKISFKEGIELVENGKWGGIDE